MINLIIEEAKGIDESDEVKFESTNQTCPLAMMSEEIKEKYIQLICNFAYADDNQIDSKEYTEIMTLIAINSVDSSTRIKIRSYMYDEASMLPNAEIITFLRENVESGSIEALELSVIKDVLNIFVCKNNADLTKVNWKESEQVVALVNELNISDDKVNYIAENIIKNKEIITKRQDDLQIKKNMQELASKAGAVGVPLAAVYLSGSVIGVSAAGMTSGLAALGMGGVLGFSSMFTGIGVAVLLGVGAYKGIKKVTGMGDLERSKQRELMLKEIAKNSQKALNYLIEDVNELSKQLQYELASGAEAQIKIKKLAGVLAMLSKGAEEATEQINNAEKENLICKLPLKIKPAVIEEMTAGATKKSIRELILNAYTVERIDENGETVANCLNTQLSFSELELVYKSLEAIGYYSMASNSKAQIVNSAKGIAKGLFK